VQWGRHHWRPEEAGCSPGWHAPWEDSHVSGHAWPSCL
jgi:hypothetical protein